MLIETIGPINDQLVRLGTRQSVIYLAKGDTHMLIGGGGQWVVEKMEEQLRDYHIDMTRVRYLLIGHSHYDHCGAVPYLQKKYPHLQVLASRGAAKLFAMEKAVRNMRTFSDIAMETMGVPAEIDGIPLAFDGITLARTLADGDIVDLGDDLSFRIFDTPGHSRCSIMAYAPRQKWLFPTDSMPVPVEGGQRLMCTASESYRVFLGSLEKIAHLPIELCGWEHFGYMTGDHARQIVKRAMEATREYKQELQRRAQPPGNVEATTEWASREWLRMTGFKFLPPNVMMHISRTMVENALAETID